MLSTHTQPWGIQHQQTNKQTTKEKGNFVLRVKRALEYYDILDFSSFPVHNFPSVVLLFAQYVGHRAHWRSVGVRTAISFSIWSEVQAAVKESPITPPPNHDWRGRKSRGGLSSPLHRAQPPPQAVAINISGSPLVLQALQYCCCCCSPLFHQLPARSPNRVQVKDSSSTFRANGKIQLFSSQCAFGC